LLLPLLPAGLAQAAAAARGNFLLFALIGRAILTDSSGIHPIAFAGWIGKLITNLNLLSVAQMDGGHIARAFSGELRISSSSARAGRCRVFLFA
jgi:membrane-associated protease RseP (regulator of RpoE activity)